MEGKAGSWERAILLNDRDALRWANLGRLHRLLGNEMTCLHATGQAFQRDPEDPTVLDERAAVLANAGAGEEALKVIDKRLEKEPSNVWARGLGLPPDASKGVSGGARTD